MEHDTGGYSYYLPTDGIERKVSASLRLRYRATSGDLTERDLDVASFQRGTQGYVLTGYCHLRNATRTLVSPGIERAINRESGELLDDLRGFLDERYAATPGARLDYVVEHRHREITVMFYLAKADGTMRAKERQVILDYIESVMAAGGPGRDEIEQQLKTWDPPSKYEFHAAVNSIAEEDPARLAMVLSWGERIVATDKDVANDERLGLAYMRKRLPVKPPAN